MTYEDYSVMGIDLSSDSDVLRWDSVWKVSIQFVMLRASMGMEEDPKFDEWMRENYWNGIEPGGSGSIFL